jgi:hypothetical protein
MTKPHEHKEAEFAALIGIDWADRKHAWALQTDAGKSLEQGELDHTPEAVAIWAADLARRFSGRPIAVALEQSRGSLLFMLTKYAHLVLFPIHPAMSVNYRKGFRSSGAKSDPSDACLLLDLLVRHREKLRRLNPDTEEAGIAPVLVSSGRQAWVHWRWTCPKFVRQTFQEWAAHSIGSSVWAKAYYEQQRAKGKSRNAAMRSLAFKWIRILFRCWKARTPYQEDVYQQGLAKRAPTRTNESVKIQWNTSAGLCKIAGLTLD